MRDPLQLKQLLWICEDDPRNDAAVDLTFDECRRPALNHPVQDLPVMSQDGVTQPVRIDDHPPEFLESLPNSALSRSDPSSEEKANPSFDMLHFAHVVTVP